MTDEPSTPDVPAPLEHTDHKTHPSDRALRTMSFVRWSLLAAVTTLAGFSVWSFWGPGSDPDHGAEQEANYYCPMHPQIVSPHPGDCPICHMKLEPIPEERRAGNSGNAAHAAHGMQSAGDPHAARSSAPSDVVPVTLSEEKQRGLGLVTSPVESTSLGSRLRVPGVLGAPETGLSQVRVRSPGFVEQVLVRQTGVRVKAGQPLAYVYSPEIYRAQEELLAALRWNGDRREGAASPADEIVTAARRGLSLLGLSSADIAAIEKSGQALRAVPVRATASGIVTRFNAILGSRAEPEVPLYEIADLSKIWLIASVPERDVSALRPDKSARFFLSGSPSEPLSVQVDLVEPLLEEATRTVRVRLVLDNSAGELRPGQFGDVEFELDATEGLFVPREALVRTGTQTYVYVAGEEGRFEPRRVETGVVREARVQVKSGLHAGERVVTRGGFMLDSESRLQASLSQTSSAAEAP